MTEPYEQGDRTRPPRLSPLKDPECPECGSTVFTERAGNREGGSWYCVACSLVFDP